MGNLSCNRKKDDTLDLTDENPLKQNPVEDSSWSQNPGGKGSTTK